MPFKTPTRSHILSLALGSIVLVFAAAGILAYKKFRQDFVEAQLTSQRQMTRIINQSLALYFERLRFVTENATLQPAFYTQQAEDEDQTRFSPVPLGKAKDLIDKYGIEKVLVAPRKTAQLEELQQDAVSNWQIYKGLPEVDSSGKLVAKDRRIIARNILKTFKDVHYVFEMDGNGNLIFLEPFDIQKNISSFNYEFRDYLRLAIAQRKTVLSEGYISHDQARTQIVTIATPIFDATNKVTKVFAASVSATALRDQVFRALKQSMEPSESTNFYLVDRHGHIVASSSGKDIYFPLPEQDGDEQDPGNLRNVGFFRGIDWTADILEKGNIWERKTRSWSGATLPRDFQGEYISPSNGPVFASFFPTAILGSDSPNWGILVETPLDNLEISSRQLATIFISAGLIISVIVSVLFVFVGFTLRRLTQEVEKNQDKLRKVTAQAAHDIRSPLNALRVLTESSSSLPTDEKLLLRRALVRIRAIAEELVFHHLASGMLPRPKDSSRFDQVQSQLAAQLIEAAVLEKKTQYSRRTNLRITCEIDSGAYPAFVRVSPRDFARMLSNLLDNAAESISDIGSVTVRTKCTEGWITVSITDDGVGIPRSRLKHLGRLGYTYGKARGTGLGIHHARECIAKWGGQLEITSKPNEGTTVLIKLPSEQAPAWFLRKLELYTDSALVVVDDDQSMCRSWRQLIDRHSKLPNEISLIQVHSKEELETLLQQDLRLQSKALFLVDYDLGRGSISGLDLIVSLGLCEQAVLITNRFDDPGLQELCVRDGIRMAPKELLGVIPFSISHATAEGLTCRASAAPSESVTN
jgi:signal transduction histidine kinase